MFFLKGLKCCKKPLHKIYLNNEHYPYSWSKTVASAGTLWPMVIKLDSG